MHLSPTIKDVVAAVEPLKNIVRPDGDNEDSSINSPEILEKLPPRDQETILKAESYLKEYTRKVGDSGDEPNQRSIKHLNKKGYPVSLNTDQYDPCRLVGEVEIGIWRMDISDPVARNHDL